MSSSASTLIGLLSFALLVLVSSAPASSRSESPPPIRREPKFKILSLHSTRLLSVTPNGDVHAKAGDPSDPSTDFYLRTHDFPRVSYESVQNPGKFLVIDHKTGQIRVEVPEDDNEKFMQIAHPTIYGFYALKWMDCYIAFDKYGSVPTNPGICDKELQNLRHTSIHVFQL